MSFMKILLWIILYPFLDAILVLNRPYFGLMTRFDDQVDDQVWQGRWVEVRGYLNDTQKYADGMSVSFNVWIRTIKIIKKKWRVKIV